VAPYVISPFHAGLNRLKALLDDVRFSSNSTLKIVPVCSVCVKAAV
jgi:hypothetical protein